MSKISKRFFECLTLLQCGHTILSLIVRVLDWRFGVYVLTVKYLTSHLLNFLVSLLHVYLIGSTFDLLILDKYLVCWSYWFYFILIINFSRNQSMSRILVSFRCLQLVFQIFNVQILQVLRESYNLMSSLFYEWMKYKVTLLFNKLSMNIMWASV